MKVVFYSFLLFFVDVVAEVEIDVDVDFVVVVVDVNLGSLFFSFRFLCSCWFSLLRSSFSNTYFDFVVAVVIAFSRNI